jgi:hypothetical protein
MMKIHRTKKDGVLRRKESWRRPINQRKLTRLLVTFTEEVHELN